MRDTIFSLAVPGNEPIHSYAPGSPERDALKQELGRQTNQEIEIPLIIGGQEVRTGNTGRVVMPHEHAHVLARYHKAGPKEVGMAIEAALSAKKEWESLSWIDRASVALKAAELIATKHRYLINAATMLNQSKNAYQAEIDSTCELVDFLRFNAYYMTRIYENQPFSSPGVLNRAEYRPLEGFVLAVTPFNFTAIAGNLSSAPALMGNTVLWKPASSAVLSAYYVMKIFEEAGFPPGVINFIPGDGSAVGRTALSNENLAGIHFTGSTAVFQDMWQSIGENIKRYKSYPRIVGETGGKDYVFAEATADIDALNTALVRGAFEYQGQKFPAASRAYIPRSIWPSLKEKLGASVAELKVGDPRDFKNFVNALIDESAFDKAVDYVKKAEESVEAEVIFGGRGDKS